MIDPRMTKLAETLIGYSTEMKSGEKILIEAIDIPTEMTCELVRVAQARRERHQSAEELAHLFWQRLQQRRVIET